MPRVKRGPKRKNRRAKILKLAKGFYGMRSRGHRIAQRGLAAVADVQRTGRIGRDEFNDDLLAGAAGGAAILRALREDGLHHRLLQSRRHAQVDEAGTGDIRALDQALRRRVGQHCGDQARGQFARVGFQWLGQLHGDIAGDVAVRGIARALQRDVGRQGRVAMRGKDGRQRGLEQGNDLLFLLGEHEQGVNLSV